VRKRFHGLPHDHAAPTLGLSFEVPLLEVLAMDGWWNEIDAQIEHALARTGGMSPAELAKEVGLSEAATVSVLSRLATEGRVRIARVEVPARRASRVSAA
jgi:hypothetical protein